MPVAAAVLNGVRDARFAPTRTPSPSRPSRRRPTGRPALAAAAAGLRHLAEQGADDGYRRRLAEGTGLPVLELPELVRRRFDLRDIETLAGALAETRLPERAPVIEAVEGRRMVVCCGAGGVGKTTMSAGLALRLAGGGARVVVVTIDPARRLATALGMEGLSDEPRRVSGRGGAAGDGELWALQLDAKATFDRLVAREAPDARGARAHPRATASTATCRSRWPARRTTWRSSACTSWSTTAPST